MWSDRYYYYNLYKNIELGESLATKDVMDVLKARTELLMDGNAFRNARHFPIITLSTIKARTLHSWSDDDFNDDRTTLIAVVAEKGTTQNDEKIKMLLIGIAASLKWQLTEEHSDDGIENHVVWSPHGSKNDQESISGAKKK